MEAVFSRSLALSVFLSLSLARSLSLSLFETCSPFAAGLSCIAGRAHAQAEFTGCLSAALAAEVAAPAAAERAEVSDETVLEEAAMAADRADVRHIRPPDALALPLGVGRLPPGV